jgi:hypothetical protein
MKSPTSHTSHSPHHTDTEKPSVKHEDVIPVFPSVSSLESTSTDTSTHQELKELIEKNIKWSQVIYHQNRKIQRRLSWIVFGSYFKLFLILIPIILGLIYLPPIVSDFLTQYQEVFGGQNGFQRYFEIFRASP